MGKTSSGLSRSNISGSSSGSGSSGASSAPRKRQSLTEKVDATIDKIEKRLKTESYKKLYGSTFGGEIDRLAQGNSALKSIGKDGKWNMSKDLQVGVIQLLMQKNNSGRTRKSATITGEQARMRNEIKTRSLDVAKQLYRKTSSQAKNQWAAQLHEQYSPSEIRKLGGNKRTRRIYADLANRAAKQVKYGKLPDYWG